jgi:CubicO group peptidase (beta-lactamase class C family)
MVVGISRSSDHSLIAYGPTDRSGARKIGGDTIFEIASLTKIFTALLLADAVVRGEAALEDPLSAYVPSGVTVPQFDGRAISLIDLATHTSGFPLRPNNLNALPDAPNKYASYTLEQLYAGLPNDKLTRPPGSKFEYSNVAFALLGQGLALKLHQTFPDLLRGRITGPLGLIDTRFGDDPAVATRRAQGHDVNLKAVDPTDDGALNPAGGLRSTANDLLRFLDLFVNGAGPGELPAAAKLMLTIDRPGDDKDTRMALGWRRTVAHGETFYWSNGSGDGSRTFMGFNPARRIAVVALANAASAGGLDDIGRRVLDPQQKLELDILPVHHAITLPAAALDRVLGIYERAPGDQIEISRGITGLILTIAAGQLVIYPESATRFFAKLSDDVLIDFPGSGPAPAMVLILRQDGKSVTYRRVK